MINKVKIFVSTILILAVSACSNLDESELRMSTDGKVLYSETPKCVAKVVTLSIVSISFKQEISTLINLLPKACFL